MISYFANLDDVIFLECELQCSINWQSGEPVVSVDRIEVDGRDLEGPNMPPMFQPIADEIRKKAEASDRVRAQVLEQEGISYRGDINDPASHWVRA